jgi:hypothetical protein
MLGDSGKAHQLTSTAAIASIVNVGSVPGDTKFAGAEAGNRAVAYMTPRKVEMITPLAAAAAAARSVVSRACDFVRHALALHHNSM